SDTFNVTSDVTEPIVTRELEGLSGVINHTLDSNNAAYDDKLAGGIMPIIASPTEGVVVIEQTGGNTSVDEEGGTDEFSVYLADAPTGTVYVYISAARSSKTERDPPNGGDTILIRAESDAEFFDILKRNGMDERVDRRDVILKLDASNVGRDNAVKVYVKAVDDNLAEGERTVTISAATRADNPADAKYHQAEIANVEVRVRDNDKAEAVIIEKAANGSEDRDTRVLEGTSGPSGTEVTDTFDIKLGKKPALGETVRV